MAMACFGFVTFLRDLPMRSWPCFISCISLPTSLLAFGPYLRPELFLDEDFDELLLPLLFEEDFLLAPLLELFFDEDFIAVLFLAVDFFEDDFDEDFLFALFFPELFFDEDFFADDFFDEDFFAVAIVSQPPVTLEHELHKNRCMNFAQVSRFALLSVALFRGETCRRG